MSDTFRLINLTDTAMVTEEELLDRAREGDKSAFGTLYLRHRDAARKVAGMCASSAADAEDAVAEGFARVFAALPRMAGRSIAFRPYLLTCVRNAATDRLRRERRVDLRDSMPETPASLQADDAALLGLERNLVGEALQALPSRWRTVLWLTEVEGLSPAEVSRRIGIKPNAVAALAYRARKGLREAYLQAHLKAEASQECRWTVSRLGNYVRGELADKDRFVVQAHLDECSKCRCRRDELTDVNATLRSAFLPVPLLLAGVQRNWLRGLGEIASSNVWTRPEMAHVAEAAESPVVRKALAGITMMVLALTGASVPLVTDDQTARPAPQVAAAEPVPLVIEEALRRVILTPAPIATSAQAASSAPAATPAVAPAPAEAAAPEPDVAGGTRSRLLGRFTGRNDETAPERGGGTRSRLLRPPSDGSEPDEEGLLAGTTLAGLVSDTLDTLESVLPLDEVLDVLPVEATSPAPGTTGSPLGVSPKMAAGTADSSLTGAVDGLLAPVGEVVGLLSPDLAP
jgi:RNA polymerase sigma factor (sigma-70 family)